jgi:hypothetical protein
MDGSTEFMVLLSPGEETSRSFPCGRYTLKTAEGDTWISDEEAFGDAGHYSTTDIFTFEAGGLTRSVAVPGVISIPMMPAGSQVSSYGGFLYG